MVEFALFMVSVFLLGFAFVFVLAVSWERARRKGYRPPGAALIILAGWTVGIGATVLRHPPNSTSYRFVVDFFWLPLLFSAAATAILIVALPRRPVRVFGARQVRFPFVRAGQVVIALGILLCSLTLVYELTGHASLALTVKSVLQVAAFVGAFVLPTGGYLIRRGRRLHGARPPDLSALLSSKPPVLYLRAFRQERQFFVIGLKSEYGAYAKSFHARLSPDDKKIGITFEEYLSDALEKHVGPFVALGSPEDYLAPEGALRIYAKDTDWMEKLGQLARHSACILVEMGKSDNLRWEFEHLRREGLQQKLFVIARPSTEGSAFGWAFWGLLWRLRGIRSVSRQEFAWDLAKLGYDLGPEDPGPGSVMTFDADGCAILLTTQADRPVEFVEPIRAWLAGREKVGRCVPISCAQCGRRIYAFPADAGATALCLDCGQGSPAKRTWSRLAPSVYFLVVIGLFVGLFVVDGLWVPEGSWVDRHIGGIATAFFLGMMALLFFVLGRRQLAASPSASMATAASKGEANATGPERDRAKRLVSGQ